MICGCTHKKEFHSHGTDFCKIEGCGCCEFITDMQEWKKAKARWDWENVEEAKAWNEICAQEEMERQDNKSPSGWTNLDNPGGTTFCY